MLFPGCKTQLDSKSNSGNGIFLRDIATFQVGTDVPKFAPKVPRDLDIHVWVAGSKLYLKIGNDS